MSDSEDATQPLADVPAMTEEEESAENDRRFLKLIDQAREAKSAGDLERALQFFRQAFALDPNEEALGRKIAVIEEELERRSNNGPPTTTTGKWTVRTTTAELDGGQFKIGTDVYEKLFPHQRKGIEWLWSIHRQDAGGILADDMGLGKTIQIISFLRGLFEAKAIHAVLIVMPKVVLTNWANEFDRWGPDVSVKTIHGGSVPQRQRDIKDLHKRGGVGLTTYGLIRSNPNMFSNNGEFDWSYVILDEGHTIKNPAAQVTVALKSIGAQHKLILTGTPVQNNLQELWTLFDYVTDGELLGTHRAFARNFEKPIIKAADREADDMDRALGFRLGETLRSIIAPYLLRREKKTVFNTDTETASLALPDQKEDLSLSIPMTPSQISRSSLPKKKELVIWTVLQPAQLDIYKAFILTPEVLKVLNLSRSPLAAIIVLRKICNHPFLLNTSTKMLRGLMSSDSSSTLLNLAKDAAVQIDNIKKAKEDKVDLGEDELPSSASASSKGETVKSQLQDLRSSEIQELVEQSGKLVFLKYLVPLVVSDGHRMLLFSQSLRMLDLIEMLLASLGITYLRIDGTISDQQKRQQSIDLFQNNDKYKCFLLTTEVGGVGLNLTGADRVVIVEPHWNPAKDAQAVDRAYIMGQTKQVLVYRLNSCGTVEEKIFRKQVFKRFLFNTATGANEGRNLRYFTEKELSDLFKIEKPFHSETHKQLVSVHGDSVEIDGFEGLPQHLQQLANRAEIFAVSDYNLLYSKLEPPADENVDPDDLALKMGKLMLAANASDGPSTKTPAKTPRRGGKAAASATPSTTATKKRAPIVLDPLPESVHTSPTKPSVARFVLPSDDDDGGSDRDSPLVKAAPPAPRRVFLLPSDDDEEDDDLPPPYSSLPSSPKAAALASTQPPPCNACQASLGPDGIRSFQEHLDRATSLSSVPSAALDASLSALDLCAHVPSVHEDAKRHGHSLGWL